MNCMKCGRETEADNVFCEECLERMAEYPVNPLTLVQIPHRPAGPEAKKNHPRRQTPEEQITALQKRCHRLGRMLVLLLLLLTVVAAAAALAVSELDMQRWLGQNYSTSTEAPAEAPVDAAP